MRRLKTKQKWLIVLFLVLGLLVRFLYFRESVYFGYDEARDAFVSQEIYLNQDLKIIGPVANFPGIHHGPLFWYLVGPLYLLGGGNPYFVSAVFRVINALGVVLVFLIGKKLFNERTGLLAALIYAFSFEQSQYALYVGNPSLAIIAWLGLFLGAALVLRDKDGRGLVLMFVSVAVAFQFEFILAYMFVLLLFLLVVLRKNLKEIKSKDYFLAAGASLAILSTYVAAELKYHFQSTRAFLNLVRTGYDVMPPGESRFSLYGRTFVGLFQDNILAVDQSLILGITILLSVLVLIILARRNPALQLILLWLFASAILLPFGGYDAYYVNVGVGVGLVMAMAFLLERVFRKNKILGTFLVFLILASNLNKVIENNPGGPLLSIKAQPGMMLADELILLDKMYEEAQGRGFTVRATTMPYGVQTVWAYLFGVFGEKKYGYLPFWEKGNAEGYPGILPAPQEGTTCLRYLLREPTRGIPQHLIVGDEQEENLFSVIEKQAMVGSFLLETREAKEECHNRKGG